MLSTLHVDNMYNEIICLFYYQILLQTNKTLKRYGRRSSPALDPPLAISINKVLYSACNRWWQDNLLILIGLKLRSFVHVFNAIWGFFFKICVEKNPYARLHYDYVSTLRNAFTQWTFIYTVQRLIRYWDPVSLDRDYSFAPVTPINIHTFKCTAVFLKTYWTLICWHTGKTWYSSKLFYFFQHGYNSLNLQ